VYVNYFHTERARESIIYMSFSEPIDDNVREILDIFAANIAITYESLLFHEEAHAAQREALEVLCEAAEWRSRNVDGHVRRVGEISALLAEAVGLAEYDVELVRQAAPLHDVGKIGIPERILTKRAGLDEDEWDAMKTHTSLG
jgi:HD-GYP domain-containing protein (c-di-GMP phosphodiesterase class II)